MYFTITLSVVLTTLLSLVSSSPIASPLDAGSLPVTIRNYISNTAIASAALKRYECHCNNLDNITMDYGALPPPAEGLKIWHIATGRGTQNYSCPIEKGDQAAPTALGAVAKLYNVTCATGIYGAERVNSFTDAIALQNKNNNFALSLFQSGNHYFPDIQATTPVFNLNLGNPDTNYGIAFLSKKANVTAPADAGKGQDGSNAVPWLKLTVPDQAKLDASGFRVTGKDAEAGIKEVYRLNTAGGAAPKTCQGLLGQSFTKEYAAEYWFWH